MQARRKELGGYIPGRANTQPEIILPRVQGLRTDQEGLRQADRCYHHAFVRLMKDLMRVKGFGHRIVPITPDRGTYLRYGLLLPVR